MKIRWDNSLRGLALLLLLGGGGRVCPQTVAQGQTSVVAPMVREIRVTKEAGGVVSFSMPVIAVKVGGPLNRDEVASSIRTLYQKACALTLSCGKTYSSTAWSFWD